MCARLFMNLEWDFCLKRNKVFVEMEIKSICVCNIFVNRLYDNLMVDKIDGFEY